MMLTKDEIDLIERLANIWNDFLKLPEQHEVDKVEFMHNIHACQYLLMSRETRRNHPDIFYFDILPKLKHRGFLPSMAQHRLLGD